MPKKKKKILMMNDDGQGKEDMREVCKECLEKIRRR